MSKHRAPASQERAGKAKLEEATFAAGCFWGIEEAFSKVRGVVSTEVGYSGGKMKDPSYRQVCSGATGHAETVRVRFDPTRVSYRELLEVFWRIHDPTQLDRQGPDVGSQYRSAIFYHDEEQRKEAERSKDEVERSGRLKGRVVTEIKPARAFYRAEEYHQQYYKRSALGKVRAVLGV